MVLAIILLCFFASVFILFCYHTFLKSFSHTSGGVCQNSPNEGIDLLGKLPPIYSSDFDENPFCFKDDPIFMSALTAHLPAIISKTVRKRSKLTQNHRLNRYEERMVVRKTKSHADLTAPVHNGALKRRLSEM